MTFPMPSEIVEALDLQVVGQDAAKRAIARALRNRWRQAQMVEISPGGRIQHHLLFSGGTGLGKSTLARAAADILDQPYVQIQVSRFADRGKSTAARIIVESLAAAQMAGRSRHSNATADDLRHWLSEAVIVLEGIDRLVSSEDDDPDASAIQSEIIPLLDGDVVNSNLGPVETSGALVIAEGAFRTCRPADLLPELTSRFPTQIEFEELQAEDLRAVMTRPTDGMIKRWSDLLAVDEIWFDFAEDAIDEVVEVALDLNARVEDLGARRLQALIGIVLEPLSFDVESHYGRRTVIDRSFVEERLSGIVDSEDLERFIL